MKNKYKWVAIDDFALRRRHHYGTIMIDLKTRKVIDLIESRNIDEVSDWLKTFTSIELVSRDGARSYKNAIQKAHPKAVQVSDRFHLVKSLVEKASKEIESIMPAYILKYDKDIKRDNPKKPTYKTLDKKERLRQVRKRYSTCRNMAQIAREFKLNQRTVKKYVSEKWVPENYRLTPSILDRVRSSIEIWMDQNLTMAEMHRRISAKGISTSYENVKHYVHKIASKENQNHSSVRVKIHRKHFIKLLYNKGISELGLSNIEQNELKNHLKQNKKIQDIIDTVTEFRIILASQRLPLFKKWIERTKTYQFKHIETFINTIGQDQDAIFNAVLLNENNGIAEGKINKLKRIKREMYGRCSFELLKHKIFLSESST